MSCSRTFIPLLRPLVAPRAIARPHRSCFSTASRLCTAQPQPPIPKQPSQEPALTKPDISSTTPVPTSSSSPPATTPPFSPTTTTTTSTPSQQTASPPRPKPSTLNFDVSTLEPPRYHVGRTANKNLGVYTDYKRGGNLKLTSVRGITGDRKQLQDDLRRVLQKKDNEVWINTVTGAVFIKGHVKQPIFEFLEKRGF